MSRKSLSLLAFALAVIGLLGLVVLRHLFAHHPALVAAGAVTVGLVTRMHFEEHYLRQTYPEYRAYARRAKRVIPFVV